MNIQETIKALNWYQQVLNANGDCCDALRSVVNMKPPAELIINFLTLTEEFGDLQREVNPIRCDCDCSTEILYPYLRDTVKLLNEALVLERIFDIPNCCDTGSGILVKVFRQTPFGMQLKLVQGTMEQAMRNKDLFGRPINEGHPPNNPSTSSAVMLMFQIPWNSVQHEEFQRVSSAEEACGVISPIMRLFPHYKGSIQPGAFFSGNSSKS